MYSDTHFHFEHTTIRDNKENKVNGVEILTEMARRNCFFGLDIGTECDDLSKRQKCIENAIAQISDPELQTKAKNFIYYATAIWPSMEEIRNRYQSMKTLKEQIALAASKPENGMHNKIIAIGECGLDHHWNPSGVDGRCQSDFDQKTYDAERELFEMQLEYAKELNLPVIIHTRDAFQDTLDCIKNVGYNNGIIHCYAYGQEEAKAFLDLGWYISFSGSVTYTKKSKMEAMKGLLQLVPEDRILCETDSPYLAPVPFRGQMNTPVFVEHTYNFISEIRGVTPEQLCTTVDQNIRNLFHI